MAKKVAIVAILATLLALGMMIFGISGEVKLKPAQEQGHLAKVVPLKSGKWIGHDIPLGETDEVIRATENILSVSEYLSRKYIVPSDPTKDFTLYISYWAAGKEIVAKASTHMPDNCWVKNGATNIKDKKRDGVVFEIDSKKLKPAYSREFSFPKPDGSKLYRKAVYWYIVDGKPYSYGSGETSIPSPINYVKNMIKQTQVGIPEQYFIRIDSERDVESLFVDDDFKNIIKGLGDLILFENPSSEKANLKKE